MRLTEDTVRLTVHMRDDPGKEIKTLAENERKSVSLCVAEAVASYIRDKKKKELGERVLRQVGKSRISSDALKKLEKERKDKEKR